jgi:hypothetical protein
MLFANGIENRDSIIVFFCSKFFKAYLVRSMIDKSVEISFTEKDQQRSAKEGK